MSHHDDAIDVATEDVKWHDAVLAVNDCLRARVEQLEAQLEAYKTPPMHQAIVPILGKLVEGYATIEDMHTVCRVINAYEAEIARLKLEVTAANERQLQCEQELRDARA